MRWVPVGNKSNKYQTGKLLVQNQIRKLEHTYPRRANQLNQCYYEWKIAGISVIYRIGNYQLLSAPSHIDLLWKHPQWFGNFTKEQTNLLTRYAHIISNFCMCLQRNISGRAKEKQGSIRDGEFLSLLIPPYNACLAFLEPFV